MQPIPGLTAVYYARYEEQLRSVAEINAAQPDSILIDTARTVLAQDHFRRRTLTVELLEELSMERAEAVYAARFADLSDANIRIRRRVRLG